jgi:hypothetical protein
VTALKSEVNPLIAGIVIVILVVVLGFFIWKRSQGPNTGPGRMRANLDMSKAQKDPARFQQELQDLLKRDREAHSTK